MKHLLYLLFWLLPATADAQADWQEALRAWMTAEDMEESYGEETMEMLEERALHPINLNQTNRQELEMLPFLTAQQVEDIVAYLDRYKPMRSLSELQMIVSMDQRTRRLLQHFVVAGEEEPARIWPKLGDVLRDGKHLLTATAKVPFYKRKGDDNGYVGYKFRHDVRYQFNYKNKIKFGLTGAQDAGEPFFTNKNKAGYDHYAYYLQLRDMGRLEELNLGTYRVQMGMGLVMNTGFQLGKLATLQSLGRSTHMLTAHASRMQSGYLQGAAATVRIADHWRLTAFASYQHIDATLNDDGSARTLLTDGYHRTETELSKKGNTHETDLGGSIGWRRGALYIHANGVYTHYNRRLQPQKNVAYRQYAAEGNGFFNASVDYGYTHYRWTLAGETAVSQDGAVATLHTVSYRPAENLTLMALHRYYDKRYTAQHARSFSEGSGIQNEHGIYVGATWKVSHAWLIQGYADYAHFGAPRYQVSAASDAFDLLCSVRYAHGSWTADGRYRLHIRQRDDSEKQQLVNRPEHRIRLGAGYALPNGLKLRTQIDGIVIKTLNGQRKGLMVGEHVAWNYRWLKADGHIAWFHTDDYDSRLYQYEPSVRYDFSFPSYYGHGLRYSLMAQADICRQLSLCMKLGVTNYFDRSTIGSGLQQVDRSSMADLLVQLNIRL